jgi:hypothetical protein
VAADLIVARAPEGWPDRYRAYRLVIDSKVHAKIRRGSQASASVAPGRHSVRMRLDWCGSQTLDLDLRDGERAYLTCQSGVRKARGNPFKLKAKLVLPLYLTVWRTRYIDLQTGTAGDASRLRAQAAT